MTNFHCLLVGELARDQQSRSWYLWGEEGCASERKPLMIMPQYCWSFEIRTPPLLCPLTPWFLHLRAKTPSPTPNPNFPFCRVVVKLWVNGSLLSILS